MVEYNPDRIVLMRRLERKTQAELTKDTGISSAKISKIQNRIVLFNEADAKKIAISVDYPLSFFAMKDVPTPPTELTYRRSSKTLVGLINAVSAEYEIMNGAVQRTAFKLQMQSRLQWINEIAPRKPDRLTIDEINRIANQARMHLGLSSTGAVPNMTRALERAGVAVIPMHSSGEASDYIATSEGVCDPTLDGAIPVIGYLKRDNTGDRLRFTKAHEFGHMILHKYRRPKTRKQMEDEAHQFAGAFLMPEDDARAIFSATSNLSNFVQSKSGWGIAISALIMRASALNIIDQERTRSLQIQLSARGWKKHEPVAVDVESPILYKQMIGQAYGKVISSTKSTVNSLNVSERLGVPFRYLDLWADGLEEDGSQLGFYEKRLDRAKIVPIDSTENEQPTPITN